MSPTIFRRHRTRGGVAVSTVPILALSLAGLSLVPAGPASGSDRTASETVFDNPPAGEWRTAGLGADQWLVVDAAGAAVAGAGEPGGQLVGRRDVIAAGSTLRTDPDGWIKLASGPYRMILGAGSAITLIPAATPGLSEIEQQRGTLLLDIRGDGERVAQVRTPQLTASAIASSFSIVVGDASASANVAWGRVAVAPTGSADTSVLPAGQTAMVMAAAPGRLAFVRTRAEATFASTDPAPRPAAPGQAGAVPPGDPRYTLADAGGGDGGSGGSGGSAGGDGGSGAGGGSAGGGSGGGGSGGGSGGGGSGGAGGGGDGGGGAGGGGAGGGGAGGGGAGGGGGGGR